MTSVSVHLPLPDGAESGSGIVAITGQVRALLSLLNALQHRVLELLCWSAGINERLMAYLLKPA